jgi:chemotaxis protein MotB
MRRITAELQPSQAVVQRLQAMQLDLQRARQHLRRERRSHGTQSDRWGLEQAGTAPQDEDWLITYLDMVTLLMVAMIVMLAFAGPVSKQIQAARREAAAMEKHGSPPSTAPHPAAALNPAPGHSGPHPAAEPAEALEQTTQSSTPALAPLAGTFPPEPMTEPPPQAGPVKAAASETLSETSASATDTGLTPAPVSTRQKAENTDARALQADEARIAGMRTWGVSLVTPPVAAPVEAPPAARRAAPAPSEGEVMAASLPLGDLGKDVEVIINKRSVSFRVNSEILFATGQTDLSPEGLAVLKRMARVLISAGYDITVEGHTDSVRVRSSSPYPSNWELSSARAGSVVRYLQANGIPKSRLKAVGFADSRPIADNGTPQGRARNRRVELVVSKHSEE